MKQNFRIFKEFPPVSGTSLGGQIFKNLANIPDELEWHTQTTKHFIILKLDIILHQAVIKYVIAKVMHVLSFVRMRASSELARV